MWSWGARTQRHFLDPQRHYAMAWCRCRQAMGTPSNWELPITGNAQKISENAIWGGVGWGEGARFGTICPGLAGLGWAVLSWAGVLQLPDVDCAAF